MRNDSEYLINLNFHAKDRFLTPEDSPTSNQRLNKALRLVGLLQTSLDLETLLRIFSREVMDSVNHSGLQYDYLEDDLHINIGWQSKCSCIFDLKLENKPLGEISFLRNHPFTAEEITTLEYLLQALVYQLRNGLLFNKAVQASLTDPLTGVYNRGFIMRALQRETGLARRNNTPLSLMIIDIDKFKQFNDNFGHGVGDQIIVSIATTIACALRETDMLARYGGDEFVILLSNAGRHGAKKLAQKINQAVAQKQLEISEDMVNLTVSIGLATLSKKDTPVSFFQRADKALLEAKRNGRNQVIIAKA